MSELEKIFEKYHIRFKQQGGIGPSGKGLDMEAFKSALTEVFEVLTKTDYIPEDSDVYSFSQQFKEKMKEKLEKLLK